MAAPQAVLPMHRRARAGRTDNERTFRKIRRLRIHWPPSIAWFGICFSTMSVLPLP